MKYLEIKSIVHKGVEIIVKIDYEARTASFVEKNKANGLFVPKPYTFANRGITKLDDWLEVVEAIKEATKYAKKELEEYIKALPKEDQNAQ